MNPEDNKSTTNDQPSSLLHINHMNGKSFKTETEQQPSSTSTTSTTTNEMNEYAFEPRISSQLSCSSLTAGLDEMGIFSSQDSDILLMDDFETGFLKRKVNDITEEEVVTESHDHNTIGQQPPRKKISTQPPSSIKTLPTEIKLSSFSSQKINKNVRKPKTIYKIVVPKKNSNTTGNSKHHQTKSKKGQASSNLRDIQLPNLAISKNEREFSNEENSLQIKAKRGRKKNTTGKDQEIIPLDSNGIFSNLRILFIQNNIGTVRLNLMKEKVKAKGGMVVDTFDTSVTHVVTELPGKNVHKVLGLLDNKSLEGIHVLEPNWVSTSIMYDKLAKTERYEVPLYKPTSPNESQSSTSLAEKTHENMNSGESESQSSHKSYHALKHFKPEKKKQDISLSPIREQSLSPSPIFKSDLEFNTPSYSRTFSSSSNSNYPLSTMDRNKNLKDPLTKLFKDEEKPTDLLSEMIQEARNLTEAGFYSDEGEYSDRMIVEESSDSEEDMKKVYSTLLEHDEKKGHEDSSETALSKKSQENQKYDSFSCMHKHTYGEVEINPNKLIIEKLQILLDHYQRMRDEWRTLSYRKAVSALKKYNKPVSSYKEAIEIPGIGDRIATKIQEIIDTGNLRRVESISKSDEVIKKFSAIHGVGSKAALKWYALGYRTFDDILKNVKLTHAQKVGIECFDDLQERIPRDEVTEISKVVEDAAHSTDPKLQLFTTGSYRRGNPTCGDIDILITRNDSDGKSHSGVLPKIIENLHNRNFITHDLTHTQEDDISGKYMGICRLSGGKYRRLDLFTVPYGELGAALLSFTGNDIFNRSIRLLARKKKMKLNQHGLYKNIARGSGGVSLNEGKLIAQRTEQEIFDALGVPWRPPNERSC
ncbi:hypothetical protein Glove_63g36 [Diversispora epigaea]|uniref:DNA polymerase lambda n=1 Tax=Diversispora epigaea TaxID=1348612 RepID=A0A397JKF9_9GLOM|nr:hypothetical protein Glove_63g36 [Diversispora epigaea]